jgi:GNAT superfamily N-acetyltransferase
MSITISLVPSPTQQKSRAKAESALEEFFKGKPAGPLPRTAWMGDGYIEARVFNNRVHLSAVFVIPEKRGQKLGQAYLKDFLSVADKHGAEVECLVKPFGDQMPNAIMGSVRELTKWYKRERFKPVPNRKNFLLRSAQTPA